MYQPKHAMPRCSLVKIVMLLLATLCVLTATVGGAYAYITAQTPSLSNRFDPVEVTCAVEEVFDGTVKKNVTVRNTGDIDAYIRATVVINWVNEQGQVLATAPVEGIDYTLALGDSDWIKGSDGFWYYRYTIAPSAATPDLLAAISPATTRKGYHLQVQVLATAIQAAPITVVTEAWSVAVTNGCLAPE